MGWSKNGTTTLSSAGDIVTVSSLTASEFNTNLFHGVSSGNIQHRVKIGYTSLDSGNNYARRYSQNGGADGTGTSETIISSNVSVADIFAVHYSINIGTEEKLFIIFTGEQGTAGAGNAPQRMETVAKWSNTSNQYDVIEINNGNTGDFDTGSNLTVLNGDTTEETILGSKVQSGSRFEATDTRKIYYGATPSLTLDENFSSDNWTDNDSTYIGVSGGALSWNAKRDGTNDASVRDLGFVASDKWVLRFKITQGSSIGATQAGNGFFFGISDSNQSVSQNASQDFVGMSYYYDNQSEYTAMDSDGTALPHLYQGDAGQNITISANDVYYFQIIRNGSSYTVEAFTNSDYSTGSLGKLSGTTTASGLRYLKILNELTNGSIPTSTNPFNGTIDDLKFYNGFTTTTDLEWTEEA